MAEVLEHKNKLYAISSGENGWFLVTKASWLLNSKKMVEEIRTVEASNISQVKRKIRLGEYEKFKKFQ